jgi:predicted dehydrogenase
MSHEQIHFGLIGPGKVAGQFLAPALSQTHGACLWSVLGRDRVRTHTFANQHGAVAPHPAYVSEDEFFADPGLDALLIASPDHSHAQYVAAAIERGKPTFVEKPMCATVAEGRQIAEISLARRVPVGVGYQLRHHYGLQQMVERVQDGALGTPHHMRVQWTYKSPQGAWHWRAQRGPTQWWSLGAFGTHCLDLIRWTLVPLCGEIMYTRSLTANAILRAENDETAVAVFQFASGATAELISSVLFDSEMRVEIFGTDGTAVAEDVLGPSGGGSVTVRDIEIPSHPRNLYSAEMEHFAACARNRSAPAVDAVEGFRNVQLLTEIESRGRVDEEDSIA